eukprot:12424137-Karenia_brevis.AAC.1
MMDKIRQFYSYVTVICIYTWDGSPESAWDGSPESAWDRSPEENCQYRNHEGIFGSCLDNAKCHGGSDDDLQIESSTLNPLRQARKAACEMTSSKGHRQFFADNKHQCNLAAVLELALH